MRSYIHTLECHTARVWPYIKNNYLCLIIFIKPLNFLPACSVSSLYVGPFNLKLFPDVASRNCHWWILPKILSPIGYVPRLITCSRCCLPIDPNETTHRYLFYRDVFILSKALFSLVKLNITLYVSELENYLELVVLINVHWDYSIPHMPPVFSHMRIMQHTRSLRTWFGTTCCPIYDCTSAGVYDNDWHFTCLDYQIFIWNA